MKKKRKKEKKQKKRILNKIISNFLIVLIILLIILILIEFKIWKYFEKKEIVSFKINDECSVMMNNILHNIKDEAGCENSCRSRCYTLNKKIYNSEFKLNENYCNECKCFCK